MAGVMTGRIAGLRSTTRAQNVARSNFVCGTSPARIRGWERPQRELSTLQSWWSVDCLCAIKQSQLNIYMSQVLLRHSVRRLPAEELPRYTRHDMPVYPLN